jgi:hypothetical protein
VTLVGSYRSPPQGVRRGRFGISRGEGEAGETTTTNGTSAKAEYQSTFYTTVASRALRVSKEPGGTPHPAQGQKPFFPGRRGLVVRLDSLLTAPRQGRAGQGRVRAGGHADGVINRVLRRIDCSCSWPRTAQRFRGQQRQCRRGPGRDVMWTSAAGEQGPAWAAAPSCAPALPTPFLGSSPVSHALRPGRASPSSTGHRTPCFCWSWFEVCDCDCMCRQDGGPGTRLATVLCDQSTSVSFWKTAFSV